VAEWRLRFSHDVTSPLPHSFPAELCGSSHLGKRIQRKQQHRVSHGGERDLKSKSTRGISGPQAKDRHSLGFIKSERARWSNSRPYKNDVAGRSQLRLATFSLPTHREVVAAAFRISALGAPEEAPGSRAFHAACLHSTPPRLRESIYGRRTIAHGRTERQQAILHTCNLLVDSGERSVRKFGQEGDGQLVQDLRNSNLGPDRQPPLRNESIRKCSSKFCRDDKARIIALRNRNG
jgi:hypothetical protein